MPGDKIEYKNNGDLYVNGKYQPQNYITKQQRTSGNVNVAVTRSKGCYPWNRENIHRSEELLLRSW